MGANGDDRAARRRPLASWSVDPARFDRPIAGLGLAIVAVGVAFVATDLTWPVLAPIPWAFFFAAVMASAWLGGLRPAMVATVLSAALGDLFFIAPYGVPAITGAGAVTTMVFVAVSALIGCLGAARRRSEARERQQRRWFHAIVSSLGDAVIATDAEGRVRLMNPAAEALTGWAAAEAEGRPVEEVYRVVDGPTRRPADDRARRALREGAVAGPTNHVVLLGRDGAETPVDQTAAPIRDERGDVLGAVVVFRDATERRRAQERLVRERERLRTIIDRIPVMVTVYDPGTRIVQLNAEFERVTGWSSAKAAGVSLMERCYPDPEYRERVLEFMRSCRDGWMDIRMRTRDGRDVETSWANIRLSDDTRVGIGLEIGDRKAAEAARRDAERRKDEFLATLAHELRNPLAPIRSAVQVLKLKDWPDPDLAWSRDVIDRQAVQMARLLDDLMDVSRIARGQLELRRGRVPLSEVVAAAVETSRPLIEKGGHELSVALPEEPVDLDADPVRLAQVFANLLNNAAKYTERGGRIRLAADRRDGEVAVTVSDTGIGLAPEMIPRLFEMFSQAIPARERSQGGLGIGLSLVKGLVERHGGTIEARSDGPGRGSAFTVRLPVAASAPEPTGRRPAEGGDTCATGCKILVADDNRDAAASLARLLEIMGNEVRTAGDGQEAVEVAGAFRPDVVLMDIGMPRLDGYQAARRIREQPWGREMTLVALTGWGQEEDKRMAHDAGFDTHMTKPVDPKVLAEFLGSVARRST